MSTPLRTIDDITAKYPALCEMFSPARVALPRYPYYAHRQGKPLVLGVSSMNDHMTDEGYQITFGLSKHGFVHCGYGLPEPETDVRRLIEKYDPPIVVIQDKREWFPSNDFRDRNAEFKNYQDLAKDDNIFKVTILKDAHQRPEWHKQFAEEIGCHAWIVYYAERLVKHFQPYIHQDALLRTYHTLRHAHLPDTWPTDRAGTLLSGAVSNVYPLRQRLMRSGLPISVLRHPGYHRKGCATPDYLRTLSQFKVAICTSSQYGYALRKIIEATAVGCKVITDLPTDDVLPLIDNNLVRIHPDCNIRDVGRYIYELEQSWDHDEQVAMATLAQMHYCMFSQTGTLAANIKSLAKRMTHEC